jgi:tetratricopeptide (TPR) repeat protein
MPLFAQATSDSLAASGWQALRKNDGTTAASMFRQALVFKPSDPVLHLGAGASAHLLGRERDAAIALKQALTLDPHLTPAALLLGEIQYHQGELDAAIHSYETALAALPGNVDITARLERWRGEAGLHRQERRSDRFTVVFEGRPEELLATRATSVLDRAFWRIGQAIGAYPTDSIKVVLYTERQFVDVTLAPRWSAGAYDGVIRIPVRGASQNLAQFDRIVTHELTHAIVKSIAPVGVPAWLHEGLAQHFEGADASAAAARLKFSGSFPLAELQGGFGQLTPDEARVVYDESLVAVHLLTETGAVDIAAMLQDLSAGQTFEQAIERFGLTYARFETEFNRRIAPNAH